MTLNPCKKCGSRADLCEVYSLWHCIFECQSCGNKTSKHRARNQAVDEWNRLNPLPNEIEQPIEGSALYWESQKGGNNES